MLSGPKVRARLDGQRADGGFGVHFRRVGRGDANHSSWVVLHYPRRCGGPNEMITLDALRVLRASGRA